VNLSCGRWNQKNEAVDGVYNPKFGYKVELGFSARDIGTVVVGNSGNVILDGVFFYKTNIWFQIGFGQTKLPGNAFKFIRAYGS
jgi:hypothetical protein